LRHIYRLFERTSRFLFRHFGQIAIGRRLTVEQIRLPIPGLHPALDGFKIVQLSDFHLYPFTQVSFIREAVARANGLRPDLTVLTGDYVSHIAEAIFELAPALAGLNARLGVFTVLGNHDISTNRAVVEQGLNQVGLGPLHNRSHLFQVGQGQLALAGVDDGWMGRPDLRAALAPVPEGVPVVLLAHEPDLADQFTRHPQVAVQLSGHTHGGQIRLPRRRPWFLPHLGRKYDYGLYRVNQSWLYTNRGLGFGSAPIRINCPPEITEIILTRDDQPPQAQNGRH
jgi:predicted MPP superfamily phosphohydrolase